MKILMFFFLLSTSFSGFAQFKGILINPRDYLNTNGMINHYSTENAFKGNLPAALLSDKKEVYYLSIPSHKLEAYVGKDMKIKGKLLKKEAIIIPEIIMVKNLESNKWVKVKFN